MRESLLLVIIAMVLAAHVLISLYFIKQLSWRSTFNDGMERISYEDSIKEKINRPGR